MNTDLIPYALGSEDGEALWFFGTLAILKPQLSRPAGGSRSSSNWLPEGWPRHFTSNRRTTRRSTS
jgi:hypothetical protein